MHSIRFISRARRTFYTSLRSTVNRRFLFLCCVVCGTNLQTNKKTTLKLFIILSFNKDLLRIYIGILLFPGVKPSPLLFFIALAFLLNEYITLKRIGRCKIRDMYRWRPTRIFLTRTDFFMQAFFSRWS